MGREARRCLIGSALAAQTISSVLVAVIVMLLIAGPLLADTLMVR